MREPLPSDGEVSRKGEIDQDLLWVLKGIVSSPERYEPEMKMWSDAKSKANMLKRMTSREGVVMAFNELPYLLAPSP